MLIINSLILGSQPPPPSPGAVGPKSTSSPERKGTVLYDYEGDKQFGEISRLEVGEEVTEVTPDDEGWTLVKTSIGALGKAPSTFIEWKPQAQGWYRTAQTLKAQKGTLNMSVYIG